MHIQQPNSREIPPFGNAEPAANVCGRIGKVYRRETEVAAKRRHTHPDDRNELASAERARATVAARSVWVVLALTTQRVRRINCLFRRMRMTAGGRRLMFVDARHASAGVGSMTRAATNQRMHHKRDDRQEGEESADHDRTGALDLPERAKDVRSRGTGQANRSRIRSRRKTSPLTGQWGSSDAITVRHLHTSAAIPLNTAHRQEEQRSREPPGT